MATAIRFRATIAIHFDRARRFARQETGAALAIGAAGLGAALFLLLADRLGDDGGPGFDRAVLTALRPGSDPADPLGPQWLEVAMLDLTSLGGLSVLILFAIITTGFLLIRRQGGQALMLATALGGGLLLSETLKGVFERARPPEIHRLVETINPSFPSGHALLSTVVYLTLGVMLARSLARRRMRAYVMGAAILIAILVGVSRIYLGAHWASDVLAGWAVGAAWASTCLLAAWAIERLRAAPSISDSQDTARRL